MPTAKPKPAPVARKSGKVDTARAKTKEPASFRFFVSADLEGRLLKALAAIEGADDARRHHVELSEVIVDAMNEGLDYYFLKQLKRAKAGFVVQQSANLGVISVQRVMAPVVRNIVGRLEHEQVLSIGASMRSLMK